MIRTPEAHAEAIHPADAPGLVTLALRDGTRWRQLHLHPDQLQDATRTLRGTRDCYLTQNRFRGPRAVARLLHLSTLWADLDYHQDPQLAGLHPWHVRDQALYLLRDAGLPAPGLTIATGRGLCLLWRHSPVPRAALPRWQACQRQLAAVLAPLHADRLAADAARVLRLIGTINGRSGALVEAISPLAPAWSFEELAREILPIERAELRSLVIARAARRAAAAAAPSHHPRPKAMLTAATYWETVLSDLQRLRLYRWLGQLPPGQRDSWLFLAGVAASWLTPAPVLRRELVILARECAGWDEPETHARLSAIVARTYAAARGERITWEGRQLDPRYRFRAATMVHWLGIAAEEMRGAGLRVLLSPDVARDVDAERKRQERQAAGALSRGDYLAAQADSARRRRPWEALGISRATYYRRPAAAPGAPR